MVLLVEGWVIPLMPRQIEQATGRSNKGGSGGNVGGMDSDATIFGW
jgi:hypothetical protein